MIGWLTWYTPFSEDHINTYISAAKAANGTSRRYRQWYHVPFG
jgi:hypothetical protein